MALTIPLLLSSLSYALEKRFRHKLMNKSGLPLRIFLEPFQLNARKVNKLILLHRTVL